MTHVLQRRYLQEFYLSPSRFLLVELLSCFSFLPDSRFNSCEKCSAEANTNSNRNPSRETVLRLEQTVDMEDPPPLASLSLTHVHYDPTDRISYISAWLALVPQGLCIMYVTLIWATREVEILLMFAGQMACEATNWLLKRYIKEERPKRESSLLANIGSRSSQVYLANRSH